jgi:mono/diheme cytochrome c family protein
MTLLMNRGRMSPRFSAVCLALLAASCAAAGCSNRSTARAVRAASVPGADLRHGQAVYQAECAACHGRAGSGGPVGPALQNENTRRSYRQIYGIVLDPAPPMPKLYPGSMTKTDLRDVAAYVESL